MVRISPKLSLVLAVLLWSLPAPAAHKKAARAAIASQPVGALWRDPADIATRNLYWGPGGKEHQPHGPFTFDKEDLKGTSPKFIVHDRDGVKWKVKMGVEACPETAASRIVWAAGYFANEDYLVPELHVEKMPSLQRGQQLVSPDGSIVNARLKRYLEGEKKEEHWRWRRNPFTGTREFNGLRVMMALLNNWDLKDENNTVYTEKEGRLFMVSDLGASFATPRRDWPEMKSKGNLAEYNRSRFIQEITPEYVDFSTPARPSIFIAVAPRSFFGRLKLRWIGRHIPRADARWLGQLLARLSPGQVRDAFRAAGYGPGEVEGFAKVIEHRIAQLQEL